MKVEKNKVYNVRVRVVDIDDDTGEITTDTVNENGYSLGFEWCYYAPGESLAFSPITPEKGTKNTEATPKYNPCRKFRKGDIVEPVERWGRKLRLNAGYYRIDTDEEDNRVMMTHCETGFSCAAINTVYLQLVTPVEELNPYKIEFDDVTQNWNVIKDGVVLCSYKGTKHPHAEKSAEAERDRLNEEYRKENQQ